jgi:hypothetical protein
MRPLNLPERQLVKPASGAAVAIHRSFQVSLSYLWISDAFAHVAVSDMANTVTLSDIQLTNALGPCAICAAGVLLPPVGFPTASTEAKRVDILQVQ